MPLSFNQIPTNTRVPGVYVEIDNRRAVGGLLDKQWRLLVLGQKTSAGTAPANTVALVNSVPDALIQFGRGSCLAHLIETIRAENPYIELWALPLADNPAGVAATGSIALTGPATANGTLTLYIAGRRLQIPVVSGDSAATVAAAINSAINGNPDLAVTSTVASGTVTVNARHKGEIGNEIKLALNWLGAPSEITPAGLTVTLTQLTGGLTNPSLTSALSTLPEEIYDLLVLPFTDTTSLDAIKAKLDARWGPSNPLEGHAFAAYRGSLSGCVTFGTARNDAHTTIQAVRTTSYVPAYLIAAATAATYATVLATRDVATPVQNVPLKSLQLQKADEWPRDDREVLLNNGLATHIVQRDGTVLLERCITTYQTSPSGAEDPSYLDSEILFTLAYLRQDIRGHLLRTYPNHKLAGDDVPPTAPRTVRPRDIRAEIVARAGMWVAAGLVEDLEQFKRELVVERAEDPNRVNALLPPNLINGLRVIAAQIQFLL